MGERDDARHQVEQTRERMRRIAHEISRRTTPEHAKERAREMARERMMRMRDRAVDNSWFAPLVGAGIGALVARALQSRAQDHEFRGERLRYRGDGYDTQPPLYYGYEGDTWRDEREGRSAVPGPRSESANAQSAIAEKTSEMKDRASEATDRLVSKAEEVKDRLASKAEEVKGRIEDRAIAVRDRLPDRERIRSSTREDTAIWALGAMALGALFGFALPVSDRERAILEPARRKAREVGEQAKQIAVEKGSALMDQAASNVERSGNQPPSSSSNAPSIH